MRSLNDKPLTEKVYLLVWKNTTGKEGMDKGRTHEIGGIS
jgi:hypothetical protein